MIRTTTALLAASAFALSASIAVACPYSKTDKTASYDVKSMKSAKITPLPSAKGTQSDSLATSDVTPTAPAE